MHALGVLVFGEGEMVPGVKPTVVGSAQAFEGTTFNHDGVLTEGDSMIAVQEVAAMASNIGPMPPPV